MTDISEVPCDLPPEDIAKINGLISKFYDLVDGHDLSAVLYAGAHFLAGVIEHAVDREDRPEAMEMVLDIVIPDPDLEGGWQ